MRGGIPEGITSQIFAVGGGDLVTRETYRFDKLIVEASGRARPWTVCIPTASYDDPDVCDAFGMVYGDSLRCRTDYLRLIKGEPEGDDFQRKVTRNEIFYIPDGHLDILMEHLYRFNVVEGLRAAYARGAVFCGVGAGAAALGMMGFKGNQKVIEGLGLEKVGIGCLPEKMSISTVDSAKVKEMTSPGFILSYMTALHIESGKYRVLTGASKDAAVVVSNGQMTDISAQNEFQPLSRG